MNENDLLPMLAKIGESLHGLMWYVKTLSRRMTLCENTLEKLQGSPEDAGMNLALRVYSEEVEALRMSYEAIERDTRAIAALALKYHLYENDQTAGVNLDGT